MIKPDTEAIIQKPQEKNPTDQLQYSTNPGTGRLMTTSFGGEPYGGRTIVFYKNQPYWMMVYYGAVDEKWTDFEGVYGFLKKALLKKPKGGYYFRGPKKFTVEGFLYKNGWTGNLDKYFGEEKIFFKYKEIYWARYMGGLVDTRKE